MGLYDALKDAISLAQKADNLELYRQLLDLSAQAIDLQAENSKLKEEVNCLKKHKIEEERIVRHKQPYLTLLDDGQQLKYCATCWDVDRILIQMNEQVTTSAGSRKLICNKCHNICRADTQ